MEYIAVFLVHLLAKTARQLSSPEVGKKKNEMNPNQIHVNCKKICKISHVIKKLTPELQSYATFWHQVMPLLKKVALSFEKLAGITQGKRLSISIL